MSKQSKTTDVRKDSPKGDRQSKGQGDTKNAKRESRIGAAVKAIQALNGTPLTAAEIATKADALYVKAGGPSNVREALWSVRTIIATLEVLGMVVVDGGKVTRK